jgi:hypothetical protein
VPVKDDTHREQTTTFSNNIPVTTPEQSDRDQQSSFGIQDVITVSSRIRATVGFSADHLNGLQAQDLSADKTHTVPFATDHLWSYRPVASVSYRAAENGTVFLSFAEKGPFPDTERPVLVQSRPRPAEPGASPRRCEELDSRLISLAGIERDATIYPAHPVAPDFNRVVVRNYVAPQFAEEVVKTKQ